MKHQRAVHIGLVALIVVCLGLGVSQFALTAPVEARLIAHGETPVGRFSATHPEAGITVTAVGTVTYPADEAFLIAIPEHYYGEEPQFKADDRLDLVEDIVEAELGLTKDDVSFISYGRYESLVIKIRIPLENLSEHKVEVAELVQDSLRQRVEELGMTYGLSETNCQAAISEARRLAIPIAQQAALDVVDAFDHELGTLVGVREYSPNSYAIVGRMKQDVCDLQINNKYLESDLTDLESDPEVDVSVGLQVTYAIQSTEESGE